MTAQASTFRSSKTIDCLVQDATMVVKPKLCSLLYNFSARRGNHLQRGQSNFAYANSVQNPWHSKHLISVRRGVTKVRAERVSRRPSQDGADDWQKVDREEFGGIEGSSIWDANAENIRRRRSKRTYYSSPELDEAPSSPFLRYGNNSSQRGEWDYESDTSRNKTKASKGMQWWSTDSDDDDDYEEEDKDDEEGDSSWLSLLNVDVKDVLMLLRWGLPAAFLLGTAVIPVMIGNPLMLLFGFTIFPTVVKYLGPLAKEFSRSAANPFRNAFSTRQRTRSRPASTSTRRRQDTARYTDFDSPGRPTNRSYDPVVSRQEKRAQISKLGGWDDLVEDRSRMKADSEWPLQRRPKSAKKLAKREQPLYIRIILAFFPFLRGWAGIL